MTVYAVDPAASDLNTGIVIPGVTDDSTAWASRQKVEDFAASPGFNAGDEVLFKCVETWTDNPNLNITVVATVSNIFTVDSYFLSGGFVTRGVSGNIPEHDGGWSFPDATNFDALFRVLNSSYVTIKNQKVRNSAGRGMTSDESDNVVYLNCEGLTTAKAGFQITDKTGGIIDGCLTDDGAAGGGLAPCGPRFGNDGINGIIRNCTTLNSSGESLLFDHSASDGLAEDNLVFGVTEEFAYFNNVKRCVARRNLLIGKGDGKGNGISFRDEDVPGTWDELEDCQFYNNLVAGMKNGLLFGKNNIASSCDIVHNEFIDCDVAVLRGGSNDNLTGSIIKNNIFYAYDGPKTMYSGGSNIDGDWDHNLWLTAPGSTMDGANDVIGDPLLVRTSGWRTATLSTDIVASDFRPSELSPVKDAGLAVPSITTIDYEKTVWPDPPNIGAFENLGGPAVTPQDLTWIGM